MHRGQIGQYLREVGAYLDGRGLTGEILVLGGAYMTLVLQQREATLDVDAYFAKNAAAIREAAEHVAQEHGLPRDWLNDAVKGFIYVQPDVQSWSEYPGLKILAPSPDYVFAMKALAGRPGDIRDLEALRDVIGLTTARQALELIERYVPARLLTPRVQYTVEDLFDERDD